jgi:exodeoxyribonuclease III
MLRVMTYNIQTGGVDDDGTDRLPLIHAIVQEARPDILAIQEANELELRWRRRLFAFERATGLRGLLVRSRSGYHGAVFIRPGAVPISLRTGDADDSYRALIELVVETAGGLRLTVSAVHLDPISPERRLAGALECTNAPPAIALGDFNNCRADDPGIAEAWAQFGARHRARSGLGQPDDRLFAALERAGYVDLYRRFHPGQPGHTIDAAGGLRIDYIFATADLAARATSCEVIRTPETSRASDHHPVVADFDL